MSKDELSINFSGITHDHTLVESKSRNGRIGSNKLSSSIAILRRHPMYDCLVLVKKYRACLEGYTLEFPIDDVKPEDSEGDESSSEDCGGGQQSDSGKHCNRRKLVSKFLDGDDLMYRSHSIHNNLSETTQELEQAGALNSHFSTQVDDNGELGQLVQVPINGLLDRLKSYTEMGIAVDSRVYAFAIGLKTAERILTTSSMKEVQETTI